MAILGGARGVDGLKMTNDQIPMTNARGGGAEEVRGQKSGTLNVEHRTSCLERTEAE
jgi:hypothetical protein